MGSSIVDKIIRQGLEYGDSNSLITAARELKKLRANVPRGHTLYLIYGTGQTYAAWPAMEGDAEQLRMIRRTSRKRKWRCTYYIIEAGLVR